MDDVLVHGLFLSCFHSLRDLLGYRLQNSTLQVISFSSFMSNTELKYYNHQLIEIQIRSHQNTSQQIYLFKLSKSAFIVAKC
jgi:hypothetical protein